MNEIIEQLMRFINGVLKTASGKNLKENLEGIKKTRRVFNWTVGIFFFCLLLSSFLCLSDRSWVRYVCDTLLIIGFAGLLVPFILLGWTGTVLGYTAAAILCPLSLIPKLDQYRPDGEKIKKFLRLNFYAMTWVVFAGVVAVKLQVYYNFYATVITLFMVIFLAISPFGWGLPPDPKFYRRLWSLLFWIFFIPTVLFGLIPSYRWVQFTGKDVPYALSFKQMALQRELTKTVKFIDERDSKKAADTLSNLRKEVETNPAAMAKLREATRKAQESLSGRSFLGGTVNAAENAIDKIRDHGEQSTAPGNGTTAYVAQSQQTILHQTIMVTGTPQQLPIIPKSPMRFLFNIPDTTTCLVWEYEAGYGRIELTLYKGSSSDYSIYSEKGLNPANIPAFISTKNGNTVEIELVVTR